MKKQISDPVRLVLALIETDLRELQDMAEEASRTVPSEWKSHAASAFAYERARKVVKKYDLAARKAAR